MQNYAQSYAAVVTLLVGLPISFASSIAVVSLASATVSATREAPRLQQTLEAQQSIIGLHNDFRPIVTALNALTESLGMLYGAVSSAETFDLDDELKPLGDPSIDQAANALREAVDKVITAAEGALQSPVARLVFEQRAGRNIPQFLLGREWAQFQGLEPLLLYPTHAKNLVRRSPVLSGLNRLNDFFIVNAEDGTQTSFWEQKPRSDLAIAGLVHLEVGADAVVIADYESEEGEGAQIVKILASQRMLSAAYLHDLIAIIPDAEAVAAAIREVNGASPDSTTVPQAAYIYEPRKFLAPELIRWADDFARHKEDFKDSVGSTRTR